MTPQEYVEAVLAMVEGIPPGRVMTYGAIADALADRSGRNSARRVGSIMATHGGGVPWHRVVGAGGRLVPGHEAEARRRLQAEGVPFRGDRVAPSAFQNTPPPDGHATSSPAPAKPSPAKAARGKAVSGKVASGKAAGIAAQPKATTSEAASGKAAVAASPPKATRSKTVPAKASAKAASSAAPSKPTSAKAAKGKTAATGRQGHGG